MWAVHPPTSFLQLHIMLPCQPEVTVSTTATKPIQLGRIWLYSMCAELESTQGQGVWITEVCSCAAIVFCMSAVRVGNMACAVVCLVGIEWGSLNLKSSLSCGPAFDWHTGAHGVHYYWQLWVSLHMHRPFHMAQLVPWQPAQLSTHLPASPTVVGFQHATGLFLGPCWH